MLARWLAQATTAKTVRAPRLRHFYGPRAVRLSSRPSPSPSLAPRRLLPAAATSASGRARVAHRRLRDALLRDDAPSAGSVVAVGDVDRDGRPDLLLGEVGLL